MGIKTIYEIYLQYWCKNQVKALPDYQDVDQKLDMTGNTSKKGEKNKKVTRYKYKKDGH